MRFINVINGIEYIIETWEPKLINLSIDTITQKRNKQNRTIKEILGHLIDSASNNHQRIIRLQYNANLAFPDYTQDNDLWIKIQNWQNENWLNIIQLWKYYNLHMIQVIKYVDESKLNNEWHDFEGTKVTLEQMIEGYLGHIDLHLGEIQELIDR